MYSSFPNISFQNMKWKKKEFTLGEIISWAGTFFFYSLTELPYFNFPDSSTAYHYVNLIKSASVRIHQSTFNAVCIWKND